MKEAQSDGIDYLDRRIIALLSQNARTPAKEIADRLQVAPSTVLMRIKSLQSRGIIKGFRAELDLRSLGRGLQALISIRLHPHARSEISAFQKYLLSLDFVEEVFFVTGNRDFLVHVAVADSAELREVVSNTLSVRSEVADTNTSVIFDHVRSRRTA